MAHSKTKFSILSHAPKKNTSNTARTIWHKYWSYIIIVMAAIILTLPNVHRDGIPYGTGNNDTIFHMIRMSGTSVRGLEDGQIVPQIDPAARDGMGIGINMFYGPMLTYALPVLRLITFSWENAYILLMFIFLLLAGIFMYKFALKLTRSKTASCLISLLYMTTPYFISDLYIRGAWGEIPAFAFTPILLLGIHNLLHEEKWSITLLWVGATGIILNHMLSIVIVFPFVFLYWLMNVKKMNLASFKKLGAAILITLGLTAFFWLPFLELKQTGLYNIFNTPYLGSIPSNGATEVTNNGLTITQYLFGDPLLGTNGVTQYNLSLFVLFGIALFIFRKKRQKSCDRHIWQLLIMGIIALIGSLNTPLWMHVPEVLLNIQFPWRLCIITTICFSIVGGYGIYTFIDSIISKKYHHAALLIITFAIFTLTMPFLNTIYYSYPHIRFGNIGSTTTGEKYFKKEMIFEYMPVVPCTDLADDSSCSWKLLEDESLKKPTIVSGDGSISNYNTEGTRANFDIDNATSGTKIRIPYMYYPGYTVNLVNKDTNEIIYCEVEHSENYGLVQISIPEDGSYSVNVSYKNTFVTYIGLLITSTTALTIAIYAVAKSIIHRKKKAVQ